MKQTIKRSLSASSKLLQFVTVVTVKSQQDEGVGCPTVPGAGQWDSVGQLFIAKDTK